MKSIVHAFNRVRVEEVHFSLGLRGMIGKFIPAIETLAKYIIYQQKQCIRNCGILVIIERKELSNSASQITGPFLKFPGKIKISMNLAV
jgi:hypothetical protein